MEGKGSGLRYLALSPHGKRVCEASGIGFVFLPAPKLEQNELLRFVCVWGKYPGAVVRGSGWCGRWRCPPGPTVAATTAFSLGYF